MAGAAEGVTFGVYTFQATNGLLFAFTEFRDPLR